MVRRESIFDFEYYYVYSVGNFSADAWKMDDVVANTARRNNEKSIKKYRE